MTYSLISPSAFRKAAKKFRRQHSELREVFEAMLGTRANDPFAPALRTHPLHSKLEGMWAAHITHSYRITFVLHIDTNVIELLDVGPHDAVYR